MIIKEALRLAAKKLSGVAQRPLFEAEILLSNILKQDRVYLHLHNEEVLEEKLLNIFLKDIEKRAQNYPVEYITKRVSFYSEEFYIEEGVLIPRPETELLIDKVLENVNLDEKVTVAEIGVGSGVISIILAKKLKNARFIATDISKKAIEVTKINLKNHSVEERVDLRNCSLLDCVEEKVDIIVSNPPYIAKDFKLDKNVLFEPEEALFGGERGDELLKRIIDIALLKEAKLLICEMGYDQKESLKRYCEKKGLKPKFYKDLAGLDRGFVLKTDNYNLKEIS
ncbi:peptide chain release factor N(5)-glutamine methyltransferase [Nitrosophilus labii]|uniref:peptide chain release factor N(5)-glutamine methyltransferase n=1 Tax=Nitrosophilus labii TaxID=2706014 RepID=UPI001657266C|nr:peptide chain release factor N(5)-glutamine methyltransferase [Nitrosophilus labii]